MNAFLAKAFMPFRFLCLFVILDLLWLKTASILRYMSSTTNENSLIDLI